MFLVVCADVILVWRLLFDLLGCSALSFVWWVFVVVVGGVGCCVGGVSDFVDVCLAGFGIYDFVQVTGSFGFAC